LIHQSDVLQGCWDDDQGHDRLHIVAAAMLKHISEELARLSKAWIPDRLPLEESVTH
jgi:hypothetical protein